MIDDQDKLGSLPVSEKGAALPAVSWELPAWIRALFFFLFGLAFGLAYHYDHRTPPVDPRSVETLIHCSAQLRALDAQLTWEDQMLAKCSAQLQARVRR